jgi:co-chaperonin GroES (HSP10)
MKKYQVLGDRVLIKPVEKKTETESGLSLTENDQKQESWGEVMAVGIGVPLNNIKLNITADTTAEAMNTLKEVVQLIEKGRAMRVKVGDQVQYGAMAGTTVNFIQDYENVPAGKYITVREVDCFGIITKE